VTRPAGVVGVGLDAVDLDRFRTVLDRRPGIVGRVFTAGERDTAGRRRDPVPALAARFAAKEAVMKAMGVGLGAVSMVDIEVEGGAGSAPSLVLSGAAARLARRLGIDRWHLSLTHTDHQAQAVAVATGTAEA